MSEGDDHLFAGEDLSGFLRQRSGQVVSEIQALSSDYLLKVSLDDLAQHLVEKFGVEPVALLRDQTSIGESGDTKMDMSGDPRFHVSGPGGQCYVPATFAEFILPFTGDAALLSLKPSTFDYDPPRAEIVGQELRFRFTRTDHNRVAMRTGFDRVVQSVEHYLLWGREQVEQYNRNLPAQIRHCLEHRKEKFLKDRGLVEALGFPIKPRLGVSQTYAAPVTRKKLPIQAPAVAAGAFKPEPVLEAEHYEYVLKVISHMALVMERSPKALAQMGEEDLRTLILVQLNGHYEGQATGETFNYEGKTDILIRVENRNIFIAECKFWDGPKAFTSTIDQLLGYTAWRDTKTAIIIFNRNKDTSAVLAQIPALVKNHPNFKREGGGSNTETTLRFILHHRDDKNRELTLTVLVFDVPS